MNGTGRATGRRLDFRNRRRISALTGCGCSTQTKRRRAPSTVPSCTRASNDQRRRNRDGPVTLRDAVPGPPALPRAEQPVARVAQAGQDEAVPVELPVDRGGVDGDVRVVGGESLEADRRGDDREQADAARAALLAEPEGGRRRAAR